MLSLLFHSHHSFDAHVASNSLLVIESCLDCSASTVTFWSLGVPMERLQLVNLSLV